MGQGSEGRQTIRAWITDGSVPVFSDTWRLKASHKAFLGLPTRYEGFIDESVAVGEAEFTGERDDDVFHVEAEWALSFPGGTTRYFAKPALLDENTPVVLQGFLEGKWFNRLLGTRKWRPSSLGNNLLAAGPGINATLAEVERGEATGTVSLAYSYERDGMAAAQNHHSTLSDLRGHNTLELVREAIRVCKEHGQEVDVFDLGALGETAATVNEKRRLRAAVRFSRIPIPNPLNARPHAAKERIVRQAILEGFGVPPGNKVTMRVTDGADGLVGEGLVSWRRP